MKRQAPPPSVRVVTFRIDDRDLSAREDETILAVAREQGISIPSLCYLEGLSIWGACRLCVVEIEGSSKLVSACSTRVAEGMRVHCNTERLQRYRRMIIELLFAERNHVCSSCVSNGHCELQTLGYTLGMDHVRYDYLFPKWTVDNTHALFGMDHNRCILCTRCVRVCWHIEGAGTKNVSGRGAKARVICDLNQPWGTSETCTRCGKCVISCPTGALFYKGSTVSEMERDRTKLEFIVTAREKKQWIASE